MKLQKIVIEINFLNNNYELIVDLLIRKYKKIRLHPLGNGRYILKGMDKHRQNFLNELINERILTLKYTNENTSGYIFSGIVQM